MKLILEDDCTLTVTGTIKLEDDASLTIYGQTEGEGVLKAEKGISGSKGTLTINGGNITANGAGADNEFYGIGAKALTVNNGEVNAVGKTQENGTFGSMNSYGILVAGDLSITGGSVTAIGGKLTTTYGGTAMPDIYSVGIMAPGGSVSITGAR